MIFCRPYSYFLICIILLQQRKDCSGADKHGRKFLRGKGATLAVATGDTVVSSLIVSTKTQRIPVHPPYRWYYAIRPEYFLSFTYAKGSFLTKFQPKIIARKEGKYAAVNFQNRGKKRDHIGVVGSLVAILMATKELPFNLLFCNSKHYVEYLSRGYTKGKWYKPLYNRTSKDCPVYAPLDSNANTAFEIYDARSFTLEDRTKEKIPLSIREWPSRILPMAPSIGGNNGPVKTWSFRTT